jgi:hypothetical protein
MFIIGRGITDLRPSAKVRYSRELVVADLHHRILRFDLRNELAVLNHIDSHLFTQLGWTTAFPILAQVVALQLLGSTVKHSLTRKILSGLRKQFSQERVDTNGMRALPSTRHIDRETPT